MFSADDLVAASGARSVAGRNMLSLATLAP
jgi:hypothetical protein